MAATGSLSPRYLRWFLRRTVFCCPIVLLLCAGRVGVAQEAQNAVRTHVRSVGAETVMKITAPFTVASVGDIIELQPLYRSDPRFSGLIQHIRDADVGFGNMESNLVEFGHFIGAVDGTEAPLEMGTALKEMGITMLNHANNHTFDGGVMVMLSTDRELDKLGIAHAGTGMDLQQARAAAYQETPKGRVGLVGMISVDDSSPAYGRANMYALATYRNGDIGGAPGENPLHLTTYHVVSPADLRTLKAIAASTYGAGTGTDVPAKDGAPERFRFFDEWYQAGPDPGRLHYEIDPRDEQPIMASIRNGKIYADFMIVTIHAHQTSTFDSQGFGGIDHSVPDFLVKLAHDSIDNGADMFVVHGMHALRGVEIYKGKPIFYDIATFIFQLGLQFGASYDILANERHMSIYENPASQVTVLTTSHFDHGKLTEVRLYPVDLGGTHRPISQLGIPLIPDPQEARAILRDLQQYSQPFGTKISIEDNVGVIRVGGN